ncbi:hypothetical protein ACH5RR_019572 [Cinchona calisaya]|uniref:Uncharacterized protein n=1 Tax=Cinchona calisaya TaxID=153742 RepID=A0ABD2ZR05_9GENT
MASLPSLFFLSRSSFSFFIFFLYFSMHACDCNARSLRVDVTNAGCSLKEFLDCKIGEKIKLTMDSIRHQHDSPSTSIGIPVQFDAIFGSKSKEEEENARTKSGRKVVESSSSSRMKFLKPTKKEVLGGSAALRDAKEEAIRSQNNIGLENIIKTDDYQPPHRNSPIHNK